MKHNYLHTILILLLFACQKEPYQEFENEYSANDIVKLNLSTSSTHLFNNGKAELEFFIEAYYKTQVSKKFYHNGEFTDTTYQDTVAYKKYNLPEEIEIYASNGEKVENMKFSTTENNNITLDFYAKAGQIESEPQTVMIDEAPNEALESHVIPIVFHMVETDDYESSIGKFDENRIAEIVEQLNRVFANTAKENAPHSIDLKVQFETVTEDPYGNPLQEKGINRVKLGDVDEDEAYAYLKSNLMWDHESYLNIWICQWNAWAQYYQPEVKSPAYITTNPSVLPGLELTQVASADEINIQNPSDIGIVFAPSHFQNKSTILIGIGTYFGLLPTIYFTGYNAPQVVNGDVDYCADTYSWNRGPLGIWKTTKDDYKSMKSVNIMDDYSIGSVITWHQGQRLRNVLQYCPLRQARK